MNHLLYNIFYKNRAITFLSVFLAVIIWIIVINKINPNSTRTLKGISIDISDANTSLDALGLKIIDGQNVKLSVTVEGPYYIVGSLKSSDFTATPRLGKDLTANNQYLEMDISLNNPNSKVHITNLAPQTVLFKLDRLSMKTLAIEVKVKNAKIPDGYIMESPVITANSMKIEGPSSEIDNIKKAVINIDIPENSTNTIISKKDIILVDDKNNPITTQHIVKSIDQAEVTIPILKRKTVPLTIDYQNVPEDFNKTNVNLQITPSVVDIAGPTDAIDAIDKIVLDTIDLNKFKPSFKNTYTLQLPTGVKTIQNVTTATVQFTLSGFINRSMKVVNFTIANAPQDYNITVHTQALNNVTLLGKRLNLQNLSYTKLLGTVDMKNVSITEGQYEVPVTITAPNIGSIWSTGDYKVLIEVQKK